MTGIELLTIDGGTFTMGSNTAYPEEAPAREVCVQHFQLGRTPVTNAQFARFVADTGYRTRPERGESEGSLVFQPAPGPIDLHDWTQWWRWVQGADWRHPSGPDSAIHDLPDHPVVHVTYEDALAFTRWAGYRLPTEAEWEFAARPARDGDVYAWGDELSPGGVVMANTWQGRFPYDNRGALGWFGTSPVGTFPPNDRGLVDLIGNVWEWTADPFTLPPLGGSTCCGAAPVDPLARTTSDGVLKGGSHLCAPEYCRRYRPSARSPHARDSGTSHIGFRVAL